jgi:hypothetical protein
MGSMPSAAGVLDVRHPAVIGQGWPSGMKSDRAG